MKKNRTMRLAALLLVLTLITSCFVGGTFAKYTTSATSEDDARVAYWGFDQDTAITLEGLFSDTDSNVSGNANGLLAPGTKGAKTFAFGYTNYKTDKIKAPEVAYTFKVDVAVTGLEGENADTDALDNNPTFKWTLKKKVGETETIVGTYATVALLEAAIENLSGDASGSKDYAAGELPPAFTSADEVYTIAWAWDFVGATAANADNDQYDDQDETDTAMGNALDLDDLKIKITISATQIN